MTHTHKELLQSKTGDTLVDVQTCLMSKVYRVQTAADAGSFAGVVHEVLQNCSVLAGSPTGVEWFSMSRLCSKRGGEGRSNLRDARNENEK